MIDNLRSSLTFVVLNSESNPSALRLTMRTIGEHFPESGALCIVGKDAKEIEENKRYANVIIAGCTITNLIDVGIKNSKTDWCFVLMAGTYLRTNSLRKYEYFLRSEKDILYPVVDGKFAFDEASINGILMHKRAISEIGSFGDHNGNIQLVKMLWALRAIDCGYKLKGIIGGRLV